jgi:acetyl-CoA C-acetyltransferase
VPLPNGNTFGRDDGPRRNTSMEALAELEPAFRENGRVTAGNSCPLNDGAAAVVVMSDKRAKELGIKPIARIVSTGLSALEPEFMGLGPIDASKEALKRAGMSIDDVDIVEINEAFAAQVIPAARAIGVDPFSDKLNPHGGAIALGHPFGMTGARIACTLLNGLRTEDKTVGLETMCVGGGQGMAMIFERLN